MSLKIQIGGIACYKPEHYDELRRLFSDWRNLPATYDQWLKSAESTLEQTKRRGI
jgi:hypothetical protein